MFDKKSVNNKFEQYHCITVSVLIVCLEFRLYIFRSMQKHKIL